MNRDASKMLRTTRVGAGALILILALGASAGPAAGGVERIEITSRQPWDEGRAVGLAGPYELVGGKVHLVVDPADPANAAVVDLDRARRDADGMVRTTAGFYLLKPVDPKRGSGALLFDVVNRGGPVAGGFVSPEALFRPPDQLGVVGDGFLRRHGMTVAGVGWQCDLPEPKGSPPTGLEAFLGLRLEPVPVTGPEPVVGLVRTQKIFPADAAALPLGHWGHLSYPVADPGDPRNVLTVRTSELAAPEVIPRQRWRFAHPGDGSEVDRPAIVLDGGFEKGKIYEAVYVARDPWVMGLGFVVVRDFVAHLKHAPDSPVAVDRALAVGGSQTGRFLRHFLYQGFNADLAGRRVFDGVMAFIGGAGRGGFNHRFGQPSRASLPFLLYHYPSDLFPFSGTPQSDPLSGRRDGLWQRAEAAGVMPKVFQVNTSWEYWGRAASLIHTTADGESDQPLHPDERIYVFASTAHVASRFPPEDRIDFGEGETVVARHPLNPANYLWSERALLLALDAWVARGEEPPPSRYPQLADGTLTTAEGVALGKIPGVEVPAPYVARHLDWGPRFLSEGVMDVVPPRVGGAYGVRVPQLDADGNELGGIRLPEIAVPLATYLPWNQRGEEMGASGELSMCVGGFVPFARSQAERQAAGDPRPSIAERYPSRVAYLGRYTEAAVALVREGYLLAEDLPAMIDYANVVWEHLHAEP